MGLNIDRWGAFEDVGAGYGFSNGGKFYAVLETKAGAFRGNHIHPFDQHTILLEGKATYVKFEDERVEIPLVKGERVTIKAGVPHVLNVAEDCLTFEWWDSDSWPRTAKVTSRTSRRIGSGPRSPSGLEKPISVRLKQSSIQYLLFNN